MIGSPGDDRRRGVLRIVNRTPTPPQKSPPTRPASMIEPVQPLTLTRRRSQSPSKPLPDVAPAIPKPTPPVKSEISQPWEPPRGGYLQHLPNPPTMSHSTPTSNLGSSHTRLRVVSGRGRRVSANRETAPLKENMEDAEPRTSPLGYKRMHSTEDMAPRKRSYDRVPLRSRGETEPLPDRPSARDGIQHLRQASCTTTSTDVTLRHSTLPSDDCVALKSRMLKEQVGNRSQYFIGSPTLTHFGTDRRLCASNPIYSCRIRRTLVLHGQRLGKTRAQEEAGRPWNCAAQITT
jgi:hypothetical protein